MSRHFPESVQWDTWSWIFFLPYYLLLILYYMPVSDHLLMYTWHCIQHGLNPLNFVYGFMDIYVKQWHAGAYGAVPGVVEHWSVGGMVGYEGWKYLIDHFLLNNPPLEGLMLLHAHLRVKIWKHVALRVNWQTYTAMFMSTHVLYKSRLHLLWSIWLA